MLITLGGMIISIISAAVIVKQKVLELERLLNHVSKKASDLDQRLDANDAATNLVKSRLDVIVSMHTPGIMEKQHRELSGIVAKVELLHLEIDRLRVMHNGIHPNRTE
jgi:hypothetical protein